MNIDEHLITLMKSGRLDAAQKVVDALNIKALNNLQILQLGAEVYRRQKLHDKAALFSNKALNLLPDNHLLGVLHATDLEKLGYLDEAMAVLDRIPKANQQQRQVLLLRGRIHYLKKAFDTSAEILQKLVQSNPDFASAHMELAQTQLMRGEWASGWEEYEWRFRLPATKNLYPEFRMPQWDGSAGLEHILLIADQGYGDCFQFGRYIPLVQQQCDRVTLVRSAPLARIMDSVSDSISGVSNWKDVPMTSAYSTLSGLPRLFGTTTETIPAVNALFHPDVEDVARWIKKIRSEAGDASLCIGVVWGGRAQHERHHLREIPFRYIEQLMATPSTRFFSLQVGADIDLGNQPILDFTADLTDFAETAAAIMALDLVITSDTSVAHLAATLGKPTWILINYASDWRWGPEGVRSSWYPSVRLFRQDASRSWEQPVEACRQKLLQALSADDPLSELAFAVTAD